MNANFALLVDVAGWCCAPLRPNQLTPQEKKEGYTLLFNGKNLDGWEGDPALWSVQDGVDCGFERRPSI